MKSRLIAVLFFAAAIVLISGAHGSFFPAIASLLLLALLCATALPLSRFLVGDGISGWIFSFPIGYLFHSFSLAVCAKLFGISHTVFVTYFLASAVIAIVVFWKGRTVSASETASDWKSTDEWTMIAWLLLALAMVALPFLHVGAVTPKGTAFRAYFNTDVFRNMATAGSLVYTGVPPENPYFSGFPLHYYWLFHVLPAYWILLFPSFPVESIFVQFTLVIALTFIAVLFLTIRRFMTYKSTMMLALPLFAFGGSYEGLFVLRHLSERHISWKAFTNLNVDGILRWIYGMPQIDTLFRPLLYAPQHLMIVTLALISIYFWSFVTNRSASATLWMLVLVFISVGFSVIVGALLVLGTGIILLNELRMDPRRTWFPVAAGALIGTGFLYLYIYPFGMFSLHEGDLSLGFNNNILKHPFGFFLLNWGALLILGIAGMAISWKWTRWILFLFLTLSLIFVLLVQIDAPGLSDVSLKAGYITDAILLIFSALFLDLLISRKRSGLATALVVLLALPASVTALMDEYNCQDIYNRRFTTYISHDKMEVFSWIRNNIDPGVRLQDYESADRSFLTSFVSELPPFANRSLYLGDVVLSKIFQTPKEELENRRTLLWYLLQSESPAMISNVAQKAKIDYIVDSTGSGSPFRMPESSTYFKTAYSEGNVVVYKVKSIPVEDEQRNSAILMEEDDGVLLSARYTRNFYPPEPGEANLFARWTSNDAEVMLDCAANVQGILIFFVQAMGKNKTMQITIDETPVHTETISLSSMKVRIPVKMAAGKHLLRIHSMEGAEPPNVYFGGVDKRQLSFRVWGLQFRRTRSGEDSTS